MIAIGSPLGLQNTVTRGIVSALRQVGAVVLVQTDAAINPGNSGGPLLDRSGRVLAVTTMRMAGRAESLGFGVGAEHVRAMLDGRAPQSSQGQRPADLFAPGRADGADGERETGEAVYERILVEAAKRADQLDASWTDFVADCLAGRAPSTRSDRGWYALWERFDDTKVSPGVHAVRRGLQDGGKRVRTPDVGGRRSRSGRRRLSRRVPAAPPASQARFPRLVALSAPSSTFAKSDLAILTSPVVFAGCGRRSTLLSLWKFPASQRHARLGTRLERARLVPRRHFDATDPCAAALTACLALVAPGTGGAAEGQAGHRRPKTPRHQRPRNAPRIVDASLTPSHTAGPQQPHQRPDSVKAAEPCQDAQGAKTTDVRLATQAFADHQERGSEEPETRGSTTGDAPLGHDARASRTRLQEPGAVHRRASTSPTTTASRSSTSRPAWSMAV